MWTILDLFCVKLHGNARDCEKCSFWLFFANAFLWILRLDVGYEGVVWFSEKSVEDLIQPVF